jgi:hypothetical protein
MDGLIVIRSVILSNNIAGKRYELEGIKAG